MTNDPDPATTPPDTSGAVLADLNPHGVLTVTLNRPNAANARNQAMRDDLARLWRWCSTAEAVRVVVLTATGDRHFCAGMDLKEASADETPAERRQRMQKHRDIDMLADLPQPTIAAVNGAALGGGLEMALACSMRVLSTTARVGLPEVTHGLVPGGGATFRLPSLIGAERALRMMLTGRELFAAEVVDLGVASEKVSPGALAGHVAGLAQRIAGFNPTAVRAIIGLVRAAPGQANEVSSARELDELLWLLAEGSDQRRDELIDTDGTET